MLDWLRRHADLDELREFGIAIAEPQPGQRHTGAYYRDDDRNVRFLHLAYHHALVDGDPSEKYGWVLPAALDDAIVDYMSDVCALVCAERPTLPYGFGQGCFNTNDGTFVQDGRVVGLTCATFVLALLAGYGIRLVDLETWPQRCGDAAWQQRIVEDLAERPSSTQHAELIRQDIGNCVRIRPEEVAAAASERELPASFRSASSLGELVVTAIREQAVVSP